MTQWTPASSCFPDAWVWLRMQPERFVLSIKEACVGGESPLGTGSMGQPRLGGRGLVMGSLGGDEMVSQEVRLGISPTGQVDEPGRQQGK